VRLRVTSAASATSATTHSEIRLSIPASNILSLSGAQMADIIGPPPARPTPDAGKFAAGGAGSRPCGPRFKIIRT
jgi:hypothetical protein